MTFVMNKLLTCTAYSYVYGLLSPVTNTTTATYKDFHTALSFIVIYKDFHTALSFAWRCTPHHDGHCVETHHVTPRSHVPSSCYRSGRVVMRCHVPTTKLLKLDTFISHSKWNSVGDWKAPYHAKSSSVTEWIWFCHRRYTTRQLTHYSAAHSAPSHST